jgi:hypothetical protein
MTERALPDLMHGLLDGVIDGVIDDVIDGMLLLHATHTPVEPC